LPASRDDTGALDVGHALTLREKLSGCA
jgi:hypothetical protein